MKKQLFLIFTLIFSMILTSCEDVASSRRVSSTDGISGVGGGSVNGGNGNGATPVDIALENAETVDPPTVELRHLIEPKVDENSDGGDYLKKLTIPKNYNGLLYLAGINISTLSEKNVKVRFSFGVDSVPKDIPATVSTATGLTPQTNVEVLVMDLRDRPFNDIQLIYDLFDYNDYDFTGTDPNKTAEPIQFNRNKKLFCRGLALKDDPTFTANISEGCRKNSDVCKYAYAKVIDQGLVHISNTGQRSPITPSEANIQSGGSSYLEDSDTLKLSRCMPNDPRMGNTANFLTTSIPYDLTTTYTSYYNTKTIAGELYQFVSPYRLSGESSWHIGDYDPDNNIFGANYEDARVHQAYGLFQHFHYTNSLLYPVFYKSKLFPLYTKYNLLKDTEYMGSSTPDGVKSLQEMAANGESLWMDGCNARSTSVDTQTGENVGSCSVTATIAIVSTDDDGVESVVDITDQVKLQLVKPATLDIDGDNVLLSSFQSCSSSNQCGSDECCVSNRCWDKSIVSQCVEDMPAYGLLQPGASCGSDYECASLCCSQTTGRCAVHDTLQDPPVYCAKASGQRCIAKEWCMKHPVTRCFIIKTGQDPQGGQTCALRCYTFEEHGDCENGICKPPPQPVMPTFDPNDANRCASACDPPDFSNGYFDFQCGN